MKNEKMKKRATMVIIAIIALIITVGIASAEPLTGEEGETQSMIIIGCALAMGIAGIGSAMGLMLAGLVIMMGLIMLLGLFFLRVNR